MVSQQYVFPFVIEPVSSPRVQVWAQFAMSAFDLPSLDVVNDAFSSLYWEASIVDSLQNAQSYMVSGEVRWAVDWLDIALSSISSALNRWTAVVQGLGRLQVEMGSVDRLFQDATTRCSFFSQLGPQVASCGVDLCALYQLKVPEYTQSFLNGQPSGV